MDTQKIKSIMARCLRFSSDHIGDDAKMEDFDTWDSLAHLNLILALEEEFQVKFPMDAIPDLTSFAAIRDALAALKR